MFSFQRALPQSLWRTGLIVFTVAVVLLIILESLVPTPLRSSTIAVKNKYGQIFRSAKCPTPHSMILPVDRPLDYSNQACEDVSPEITNTTDWRVAICMEPLACNQFTVRISRDKCEDVETPTDDPKIAEWMKGRGSDSFTLRTNGAQRWTTVNNRYDGDCQYSFDVSLSNGGAVWLEIWHAYEAYHYLDEKHGGWPKQLHLPLFSAPLKLHACPDYCPMIYPSRFTTPEPTWPIEPSPSVLPACPRDEPVQGIWLTRNPMDTVDPPYSPVPPMKGIAPLMGHVDFYPNCRWSHAGRVQSDHSACIRPQNIMWAGDSHSRYSLINFMYRMEGNIGPYPEDDKGTGKYGMLDPDRHFTFDNLTIDFQMDAFGQHMVNLDAARLSTYDAIIFSNGAWAAMAGKSTAEYVASITSVFEHVKKVDKPDQKRIYLVPAPFPPQTGGLPEQRGEGRTNEKLGYWRDRALELAEQYGWMVVDQYERGMPVVLEMLAADSLHLAPGPAIESIVDEIVDKAGMC